MRYCPIYQIFLSVLLLVVILPSGYTQKHQNSPYGDLVPGEYLIQLRPEVDAEKWSTTHQYAFESFELEYLKTVSPSLNAALVKIHTPNPIGIDEILNFLIADREVLQAFPNRLAAYRISEPNDPLFPDQWHLSQIMAPEAWEIARGGTTLLGDTIVIAVIDSGCQLDHSDLKQNLWYNRGEIQGSGEDEDGNGYTDDYYGLNVSTGNDNHSNSHHGTNVTGAAAAVTDNEIGISSPAWQVEVMVISKSQGLWSEGNVIEAYEYALNQRKIFNQTNGAEGAFVVATNFSAGWDEGTPEEFPLLCEMYNTLGREGILSTTAVVNSGVDVDVFGDIPTLCPSPFKLSVTNSDRDDRINDNAGYSTLSVDLAAPGTDIYSTGNDNDYTTGTGSSLASPLVTAAIALMYSADCADFAALARSHPEQTAMAVRNAVLAGVDRNPNLEENTVSGGRLNLFNSLLELDLCETALGPLAFTNIYPNPTSGKLTIEFETPDFEEYKIEISDIAGRKVLSNPLQTIAFSPSFTEIDVSQLPAGAYLINIVGAARSETFTFIKQ